MTLPKKPTENGKPPDPVAEVGRAHARQLLEKHAPPSVVVNSACEVVHVSGNTEKFLVHPPGEADFDILGMARPALRVELHAAISRAAKERAAIVKRNLKVPVQTGGYRLINLRVEPLEGGAFLGEYLLVAFEEASEVPEQGEVEGEDPDELRSASAELRKARVEAQARAEEAERSRRVLNAIMEHIPLGIAVAEAPDARIAFVSRCGQAMTGLPREHLESIPAELQPKRWGILHPDGSALADAEELPLTRAIRGGEVITEEEWVIQRPDGRRVPILCAAGPIRDPSGRVTGGVIGWQDMTERKEYEEKLTENERRKDEFLAVLGHELRNPLTSVVYGVHALSRLRENAEMFEETRTAMERQCRTMKRLLDDLLDVARISKGKIRLQREHVRLGHLVERALRSCSSFLEERGHEVEVSLPDEEQDLHVDPTRVEQVLWNLLDNATKYTSDGGRIEIRGERRDDTVVLSIKDNGEGIPPDLLPVIFDRFKQKPLSIDRKTGGMGLGLTIVKHLVELHGGSIAAWSEGPGKGSEFVIELPARADDCRQRDTPPFGAEAGRDGKFRRSLRVLLVEDNPDVASATREVVKIFGHEVHVVHRGDEALDIARRKRFDIALIDIGLPDMDGYEVARKLRQERQIKGARLVAITGYGQKADRERSRESGFSAHLVKPVEVDKLEEILRTTDGG